MSPITAKCVRNGVGSAVLAWLFTFVAFASDFSGLALLPAVCCILAATGATLLGGAMALFGADRAFTLPILTAGIVYWAASYLTAIIFFRPL